MSRVVGMEILGERPAWSLNDAEKVSRLDATVAVINSMKTYYLQLVADLDASGHAKDIGAGDTARFLSQRYLDPQAFHDEAAAEFTGDLVVAADLTRTPVPTRR